MGTSLLTISWPYLLVLIASLAYFIVYSYRHNVGFPWRVGIVIVGILVSGYGYTFGGIQDSRVMIVFSINLSFVVGLLGVLWNINNIQEQFYIKKSGKLFLFIGIGLMLGFLLGFFQYAIKGLGVIQDNSRFTLTAIVASIIQISIAEEIIFRGYFLSYLRKYGFNPINGIIFQALAFAILHISNNASWVSLCLILLVGIVTGYLTWKSNNLIPAIILHVVDNLVGVVWWLAIT
jgi:membrane protease YdiL (CAAX protease family)